MFYLAKKIFILGTGNILLQDEGAGVHAARLLTGEELPPEISVIDAGTKVETVLPERGEAEKIIIIDALRGGNRPGTIYRLEKRELLNPGRFDRQGPGFSLHGDNIIETLHRAESTRRLPDEVIVFGIEPKQITYNLSLSPEVESALPRLVELIKREALRVPLQG